MVQDGITYKGEQVVVPRALRAGYLLRLHVSHMGKNLHCGEPRMLCTGRVCPKTLKT